jgi:hypothetical protein
MPASDVGPLEREVHEMMKADIGADPFTMDANEAVILILGQLAKIERAVERVAAVIDRIGKDPAS